MTRRVPTIVDSRYLPLTSALVMSVKQFSENLTTCHQPHPIRSDLRNSDDIECREQMNEWWWEYKNATADGAWVDDELIKKIPCMQLHVSNRYN